MEAVDLNVLVHEINQNLEMESSIAANRYNYDNIIDIWSRNVSFDSFVSFDEMQWHFSLS